MDWHLNLNYGKRKALFNQAKALEAQYQKAVDALMEQDEREQWTDEKWTEEHNKVRAQFDQIPLYNLIFALEYKEVRNQWFKSFLESFGICESKQITIKQAAIFEKYCEQEHTAHMSRSRTNGTMYYARCNGKFIKCSVFHTVNRGYVTITELPRI